MNQSRLLLAALAAVAFSYACGTESTGGEQADTSTQPDDDAASGDTNVDPDVDESDVEVDSATPIDATDAGDSDGADAPDADAAEGSDTRSDVDSDAADVESDGSGPDAESDGSGETPECVQDTDCPEGFECNPDREECTEIEPTCDDGTQNGDEEGVDCGGSACEPCIDACDESASDCLTAERCVLDDTEDDGRRCVPVNILILEEGSGSETVGDMLETLGADVVRGPLFEDWDGLTPGLDGVDSVIWMEGDNYGDSMSDEAQSILRTWVDGGGGLVRTEWALYSANEGSADVLVPVGFVDGGFFYGSTWSRIATDHPIGASLVAEFEVVDSGHSLVQANEGAVVVWESDDGYPMVTVTETFGGRVVHVNNDILDEVDVIDPNVVRILADAAIWAAGLPETEGSGE
jgi:hypothetical protein